MVVQTWTEVILGSLQNLWGGFISFLPSLIGAFIVFVLGWIVALAFSRFIARIIRVVQIDAVFDKLGLMKAIHKSGIDWEFSGLVGWVAKWFLMIGFFLAGADILGLTGVSDFLGRVLAYIPNIFVAALILVIAALLADFLEKIVKASARAAEMSIPRVAAVVVRWSVWIFAFVAILDQLGIAENFVNTLFIGLVAFLAIAGGLSFGLGGQGVAREWLEELAKEVHGSRKK